MKLNYKNNKRLNNMKEYHVEVYNINTGDIIDDFIGEFQSINELREFMNNEIHNYSESYLNLHYNFCQYY